LKASIAGRYWGLKDDETPGTVVSAAAAVGSQCAATKMKGEFVSEWVYKSPLGRTAGSDRERGEVGGIRAVAGGSRARIRGDYRGVRKERRANGDGNEGRECSL